MYSPSLISVGPENIIAHNTLTFLQTQLCEKRTEKKACYCTTCAHIAAHQSPFVTWLEPSSDSYVLKDLDPIFSKIRFSLDDGEKHFFILQNAHRLSPACANRLLKVMEEPGPGYTFIVLTHNEEALLDTITSRCTTLYRHHNDPVSAPLLDMLCARPLPDPQAFEKKIKDSKPSIHDAALLAHQLSLKIPREQYADQNALTELLTWAQRTPPMPGGTLYFLKTLFLGLHRLEKKGTE